MASLPEESTWLSTLLASTFFAPCTAHVGAVVNIFSLDRRLASCPACAILRTTGGSAEKLLQIRRSSYHDVLRVADVVGLLEIGGIQTYLINQAKVVFLNQRPLPRAPKSKPAASAASGRFNCASCRNCQRNLQSEVATYCSIACKAAKVGDRACLVAAVAAPSPAGPSAAPESDPKPTRVGGLKRTRAPASAASTPVTPSRPLSRRKGNPRRSPDF